MARALPSPDRDALLPGVFHARQGRFVRLIVLPAARAGRRTVAAHASGSRRLRRNTTGGSLSRAVRTRGSRTQRVLAHEVGEDLHPGVRTPSSQLLLEPELDPVGIARRHRIGGNLRVPCRLIEAERGGELLLLKALFEFAPVLVPPILDLLLVRQRVDLIALLLLAARQFRRVRPGRPRLLRLSKVAKLTP